MKHVFRQSSIGSRRGFRSSSSSRHRSGDGERRIFNDTGKKIAATFGIGAIAVAGVLSTSVQAAGRWDAPPPPPPPLPRGRFEGVRDPPPPPQSSGNFGTALKMTGFAILLGGAAFLVSRYRICAPNELLCVYGATTGSGPKIVTGGGTFVWPIVQGYRYLSLEPFAIEIGLHGALSAEKVRVNVPSAFTIAISTDESIDRNAITRLLDMDEDQVRHQSEEIILGQLRSVIASMSIDEINRDRIKFEDNIRDHCEKELKKIGLGLINVNIINIEDESGVIEAMGKKAAAEAVQKAIVDVALHEKEGTSLSTYI